MVVTFRETKYVLLTILIKRLQSEDFNISLNPLITITYGRVILNVKSF